MLAIRIVQDIGSYAGLAAVVGLAILSALYFSQARDVRRLRDWAGRAPERSAQQQAEVAARAATPAPAPAAPAKQPTPAKQPAPATGGNAGKGPTPAKAPTPAKTPAPATASAAASGAKPAVAQASKPKTPPAAAPKPATPPPRAPARTAVLPPTAKTRPAAPTGRQWPAPRYIALIVVGVLVVGGGMAYGVSQLVKKDHPSSSTPSASSGGGGGTKTPAKRPSINPSTITVSVLNGTTVPGLAADTADKIEAAGFQRGNTANFTDQSKAESVVLYANGASRAARFVASKLGISQTEAIDSESQALAGDATVVVVVGNDRTQ